MVCWQQGGKYSEMDMNDDDKHRDYVELEIFEMLDVTEETNTSEDLDNKSTQSSEEIQDYGKSEDED